MATKEDVQAFSKKYGSPLSGGVKIRTSDGKVENIPYSAVSGAALRYNTPLYKNSSGEWSSTPEVRLYVDKENKRINLEAPASFYDRASFKQQFSENSILDNYAKNYNINPNVTYVNEDDPDNPLTTEQLISKMNEDLQSYAKAVNNQEKLRLDLSKTGTGKIAQGLTEQDFAIMSTHGLGEEASGKSLIAIPKITGLNILDKIHGLKGYDKKNSVLTVDEFRNNVFNLSKMSGEELYQSYKALANYANYLNNLEDPTDEQVTEWARVKALLTYMGNAKVEGGTWEQAKLLANVIPSTGQAAVAAIGQTFTFIETISNAATYLLPMNWGREWEDTIGHRDIFYNATTQLNENLAQTQAQLDYLNNVIGGVNTIGRVVGTGAAIYGEGMVGSALLEATTNYLVAQYGIGKTAAATATALGEDATAAAQGARAAFRSGVAGQLGVTETPSALVTASKSILALAKTDSTYLLNGTATLINTLGGAAQAGSQALDLIRNAAIAAKAAYIGGTIAGALSNIVIATVALNGTTFRDYIATGDPELGKELKDAIAWQAAMFTLSQVWNIGKGIYSASKAQEAATTAAGSMAGLGAGDIASTAETAASDAFRSAQTTTVGSIAETSLAPANIALSKAIVSTQGRVGAVKESIKKAVLRNGNYIANIGSPNKRQAEESAAIIREAALAVGKADGVENTREALTQYVAVQEAEDLRTQGVNEALSLMTNEKVYPDIAKSQVEIVAAEQKLAKIEKMYNLPVRDQAGASTSLVQDNYAGALDRVQVIQNDIEITGKATEGQNTELEHWNQVIEDTEANYPELAAVVKNELMPVVYRLNAAITEYERVWHTQPEADLNFYATSPRWKHGYAHMQRVSEATEAANQRRYLAILERRMPTTTPNQHYSYGSTEDFMNPYQAAQNRMIDIAIAQNARNMANTMTGYQGAKRVVKVNGQDYARTKTIMAINRQQDHVAAQTRKTIRSFAKGEEGLRLLPAVKEWANNILAKASQASSTRSAARANAKTIRVDDISDKATRLNPYKLTALQQLPDQNVATLANTINGLTFQGITPDEFDEVIHGDSLDKKAKTAVRKILAEAIGQNAQFIGWDNAMGTDNAGRSTGPEIDAGIDGVSERQREKSAKAAKQADNAALQEWRSQNEVAQQAYRQEHQAWVDAMETEVKAQFEALPDEAKKADPYATKLYAKYKETHPEPQTPKTTPLPESQQQARAQREVARYDLDSLVDSNPTLDYKILAAREKNDPKVNNDNNFNYLTRGEQRRKLYQKGYDNLTPKAKEAIDKADNAFTQRTTQDMVLYRGETAGTNRALAVGEPLDTAAWTYAQFYPEATEMYRKGITGGKKKVLPSEGYLYRYHVPAGTPVFHSQADPSLEDMAQGEFILPREIKATVTNISTMPADSFYRQPYTIVDVEIDPNSGVTPQLAGAEEPSHKQIFALTYDNYTAAANLDSTLPRRLDETMLMNSAGYKNNPDVISAAKRLYISHQKFLAEGLLKDELGKLQEATKGLELSEQDLMARTNNLIDSFLGEVYADKATSDVLDALTVNEPDVEVAKEYVVLWELWQNTRELGEALESSIYSVIERDIAQYNASIAGTDKKLLDSHDIANRYTEMFKTTLYERRNIALNQLKEQGSPLVKTEDVYREIRDLQKEMTQASSLSTPNMLPVLSADGNTEILEVDPMVADLIQFRPTPESYTPFQKLMRNKAFEYSHRLFRLSTTGVNAGSLLNQFFRDPLSAWITAGTTQGPQAIYRNIMVNFGPQILDDFRTNEPTLFKHLEEVAKQRGVDISTQVKDYLAAQGEAIAAGGTETAVTRFADQDSNIFDVTKAKAEKIIQIMETPNEWREQGLRKANYARGVQRAMRQGYNTQQAQLWGARTARDATTDFNRMTVHLQAFTNSTPYLRSAINAPKSFYRMLSLDPIGMALRLTTGIFIPMVAGIISVCRDPETKEQYKQLNEYEKDGVLIFNFGGSLQKIPIPQEAGQILSPIRSLIEKVADANDKDLSLLMANDMLGFSPMNWPQDILDVDHNILMDEATWGDRLMMGALGAFSEMSPLLVKSVFEAIYGVDPYTGEPIDKSYYTIDADDNWVLMDSETSEFARWLGSITGWAPSIIAAAVEDLVGQSATNLLNWLVSIGNYVNSGGEQGNPLSILDATAKQVAGKLTVAEYDRTAKRWRDAVSGLSQQKADLMEGYQKYTAQINAETNTAKRKELIAKRQDYVSEYINNVKSTVDTMIDELGGSIDSYRFATVVNLLNFDTATNVGTTEYSRTMGQELLYEGKEAAQRTIEMMGIRNTIYGGDYSGQSLLGYYYKDNKTGEVKYNFYTPLQILNAQSVYYNKQDLFTADIEAALKTAGITRSAMFEGYNDLTKAQKKQYKRDWNSKVIKTLWPYVEQYGANNIISNQEMVDLFSRYIFVDNPYTAKQYLIEVFGGATK